MELGARVRNPSEALLWEMRTSTIVSGILTSGRNTNPRQQITYSTKKKRKKTIHYENLCSSSCMGTCFHFSCTYTGEGNRWLRWELCTEPVLYYHVVSQNSSITAHFPQQPVRGLITPHLSQHLLLCLFYHIYPSGHKVTPHCGIALHCPNSQLCWAPFPVLLG